MTNHEGLWRAITDDEVRAYDLESDFRMTVFSWL